VEEVMWGWPREKKWLNSPVLVVVASELGVEEKVAIPCLVHTVFYSVSTDICAVDKGRNLRKGWLG
jgi:hypothetical protein